jgi:hypothetical protein
MTKADQEVGEVEAVRMDDESFDEFPLLGPPVSPRDGL